MPIKDPIKLTVYELINGNLNSRCFLFGGWKEEDDLENNRLENLTLDLFTMRDAKNVKRNKVQEEILKPYKECRDGLMEQERGKYEKNAKMEGEISSYDPEKLKSKELEEAWNAMDRLQKSYRLTDWNIRNSTIQVYSVQEAQNYLNNPDLRMNLESVRGTPLENPYVGEINESLKQIYKKHNKEPDKVM